MLALTPRTIWFGRAHFVMTIIPIRRLSPLSVMPALPPFCFPVRIAPSPIRDRSAGQQNSSQSEATGPVLPKDAWTPAGLLHERPPTLPAQFFRSPEAPVSPYSEVAR